MNENYIYLKFDKLVTNLAGNKFGRSVYKNQVKSSIDYSKKNIIVLSDNIEDVAMSFIQGFCYEIAEKYGKNEAGKIIEIQSNRQDIVNKYKSTILL